MTQSNEKLADDARLLKIMALFDKMEVENKYEEREKITWEAYHIVLELNDELKRYQSLERAKSDLSAPVGDMPERIWANRLTRNYGNWGMGKRNKVTHPVEYIRADLAQSTPPQSDCAEMLAEALRFYCSDLGVGDGDVAREAIAQYESRTKHAEKGE